MNIAVFIKSTTFHNGYGGFEIQNKLLCEALVSKGNRVVVYSPRKELNIQSKNEEGVIYNFINCRFGNFKTLYSSSKDSWGNRSVEVFLADHEKQKFDIVIGQSSWALPIIKIKDKLGIRVISILHGTKIGEYQTQLRNVKSFKELAISIRDLPHVIKTFFGSQREFTQGSDKLIAVSNFVKKAVIEETYVPESKIEVIHNGVDQSLFKDLNENNSVSEKIRIIYIGRVIRSKGLFILLDALERLSNKNWEFNIVGSGDALDLLKDKVLKKKMGESIKFIGQLDHKDVLKELKKSDIFVLPSLRLEGFPMTIVEAMFAGLPTVASDIGGNSDAVIDGETGYLTDPGNVAELAAKLGDLVGDSDKRKLFGVNARNKANKEFTIEKMLSKYEQVIKEVLK